MFERLPNAEHRKACVDAWGEAGCDFTWVAVNRSSYWVVFDYSCVG